MSKGLRCRSSEILGYLNTVTEQIEHPSTSERSWTSPTLIFPGNTSVIVIPQGLYNKPQSQTTQARNKVLYYCNGTLSHSKAKPFWGILHVRSFAQHLIRTREQIFIIRWRSASFPCNKDKFAIISKIHWPNSCTSPTIFIAKPRS